MIDDGVEIGQASLDKDFKVMGHAMGHVLSFDVKQFL